MLDVEDLKLHRKSLFFVLGRIFCCARFFNTPHSLRNVFDFGDERLEADHGALKRLFNPTRGFKTLPTASGLRGHAHDLQVAVSYAGIGRDRSMSSRRNGKAAGRTGVFSSSRLAGLNSFGTAASISCIRSSTV